MSTLPLVQAEKQETSLVHVQIMQTVVDVYTFPF